jgi:hypothetical protein
MKKTVVCFILFLLFLPHLFAQEVSDFGWEIVPFTNTELGGVVYRARINAYRGNSTEVIIPSSLGRTPVMGIGTLSFAGRGLTGVIIPDTVYFILSGAFEGNLLTSVTIPNNVRIIGEGAFMDNLLTSVTIPNSVISMGRFAFEDNPLLSVTIGANVEIKNVGRIFDWEVVPINPNRFAEAYYAAGRLAGTYTRPSTASTTWTWRERGAETVP